MRNYLTALCMGHGWKKSALQNTLTPTKVGVSDIKIPMQELELI
jgi:hypothetical protein